MKATCIKTHIVETEATELEHGEKFVKKFEIVEGMTGIGIIEGSKDRIMIKLDNPITAINEAEAPYNSVLHRTFIPIDSVLGRWEFSN